MPCFQTIKWIDEGTPITLYGDGSQARDFTYVNDIARGTILAGRLVGGRMTEDRGQALTPCSKLPAPSYEVINLGGGNNPLSITAMIAIIEQALADGGRRTEDPPSPGFGAASGGRIKAKIDGHPPSAADMQATWADIFKARRLLGWSPEITPADGFQRAVDWHLTQLDFVHSLRA